MAGITGAIGAYRSAVERLKENPANSGANAPQVGDFQAMVRDLAEKAVKVGESAEQQTAAAAAGKADLNTVVMAVAEAELTLNTVVAVRDKVLEAYREIIRMPI
jgi:flagellar hook-basal body complex protein FliE